MERILNKTVELNILPLTESKKNKLDSLYFAYQSVANNLFDAIEFWDGFTELPLTSTNLHHLTYKDNRKTKLPADLVETCRIEVFNRRNQNRTVNIPIRFNNNTMRFSKTRRNNPVFVVTAMQLKNRIAIPINQDGAFRRFNKFLNDGFVFNSILVFNRNKHWIVQVNFTKTITIPDPTPDQNIVGVDIGSTNLATISIYNQRDRKVIRTLYLGRDVAPKQRKFEVRRSKLQSCGRTKDLTNDQANFTKTRVYQTAHQIVNIAKQYNAYIAIEDLDGFTDIHYTVNANRKIHRIPTRLGEVIGEIGIENGVPTVISNKDYTSQDCFKCGDRHKTSKREYKCPMCGLKVNRDINASINIASRATMFHTNQLVFYGQKPRSRMPVTASVRFNEGFSSQHIQTSEMPCLLGQG